MDSHDQELSPEALLRPGALMEPRRPGYNVDRIDIGAGLREAAGMGLNSAYDEMRITYALQRHGRSEEEAAQRMMLEYLHNDLSAWLRILAAARASGEQCQVHLIHPDKNEARCVLSRSHLEDDSDHRDEHGHTASVLVSQTAIREVEALARYDEAEAVRKERLALGISREEQVRELAEFLWRVRNELGIIARHPDCSHSAALSDLAGRITAELSLQSGRAVRS